MTYCAGLCLDAGLVLASDSRTHAGVDYVTTYSKMRVFKPAPDRVFVILSAGNLAITQEIMSHVQRDLDRPPDGPHLASVDYLFEAAEYLGRLSTEAQGRHAEALHEAGVSGDVTMILGGQIRGRPHGLMMIYPQGNWIAASPETPYLQIGESKYGKPVLDRIASPGLTLEEGGRLLLVSLDATSRSNITVGPPYEVGLYRSGDLALCSQRRFGADDPFLRDLQAAWQAGIGGAFHALPRFEWEQEASRLGTG
jgi:putative proteasome-type protease